MRLLLLLKSPFFRYKIVLPAPGFRMGVGPYTLVVGSRWYVLWGRQMYGLETAECSYAGSAVPLETYRRQETDAGKQPATCGVVYRMSLYRG